MQLVETGQLAVTLPHFDGPFDLLLDLIRKNEYPMENLPIAAITGQFLAFVQEAQSLDVDLGGEFSETASWLVLLKSRSMLPHEASVEAQQGVTTPNVKNRTLRNLDHSFEAAKG